MWTVLGQSAVCGQAEGGFCGVSGLAARTGLVCGHYADKVLKAVAAWAYALAGWIVLIGRLIYARKNKLVMIVERLKQRIGVEHGQLGQGVCRFSQHGQLLRSREGWLGLDTVSAWRTRGNGRRGRTVWGEMTHQGGGGTW